MTRYEFLKKSGFTGGALMALLSCVKENDKYVKALTKSPEVALTDTTKAAGTGSTTTPIASDIVATKANAKLFITTAELGKITGTKAKIDLAVSTYANLNKLGGYVILNSAYVVALSKTGAFIAATVTCSHEPKKRVIYSNEEWYCTDHGARFSLNGAGLNNNGRKGLTIYKVATDGKTLVIY